MIRTYNTIGAPSEHRWWALLGDRVRCCCGWSARAATFAEARASHVAHVDLQRMLERAS